MLNINNDGQESRSAVYRSGFSLLGILLLTFAAAGTTSADTLTLVSSPSAQSANDSISWSQLGKDQATVSSPFSVTSASGSSVSVALAGSRAILAVVCPAPSGSLCSWTGSGFFADDTLLWTADTANGGTGPITLTFAGGVSGAGALIQADAPGSFTAQIEAFSGSTSLGTFTVPSNNGNAVYIGVNDATGPNITSVTFSLAKCASSCDDFALDTVQINGVPSAPVVQLSSSNLTFGSQPVGTTSAPQVVTLKNTGNATLDISAILSDGDFAQTNNCGTSVAPGGSCSISITFTPTAAGPRTGAVTITDNASNSSQVINLNGTGVAPTLTVGPLNLNFGTQPINTTTAPQSVTVKNNGSSVVVISGININGDYAQTNNCGTTLSAGASCSISVTFHPTTTGTRTGTLTLLDSASGSPQTISLTGVGTNVQISPAGLTFPATALGQSSSSETITLTNFASTALTISNIVLTGPNSSDFSETNGCDASLAPGASCIINVTFHPQADGTRTASISITDTGFGSPQLIPLSGTGTGSFPAVKLSASSLNFGTQPVGTTSAAQQVTLTNTGGSPLTISSITSTGDYAETNNCGTTLAAGANCMISITFTPTTTGTRTGAVTILDNASTPTQTINLTGVGTNVELSPTALTFPSTALGQTSPAESVTLTNLGATPLSLTNVSLGGANPGDFTDTNGCDGTVPSGGSCIVSVTFHPQANGTRAAFLSFSFNGVGSPLTVALSGVGTGSLPVASLSTSSLTFGTQPIGTTSAAQQVTLSNTGGSTLDISSISTSGDFADTTNCGRALAAGSNCTINVTFTPTATGTRTGTLTIIDNASNPSQIVNLTGTGTNVELTPGNLSFASTPLGQTTSPESVTVTNVGTTSITVTGVSVTGANPGDFSQTNGCPSTLTPGASCLIDVTFHPQADGLRTASIAISDSGFGSPQLVPVSGTGTGAFPTATLTPPGLTFSIRPIGTTSPAQTVTLQNTSASATLLIASISIIGDFAQTNNCPSALSPGASCQINVTFTPTGVNTRTGTLTVLDNTQASSQTVTLTGTGTNVELSTTTLSFPATPVGQSSASQTVVFTNVGITALDVTGIIIEGADPADFADNSTCNGTLPGGASCNITVTFHPKATGARTAQLVINDTGVGSPQSVSLSGTGE